MDANFTDLIEQSSPLDLSIFEKAASNTGYERAKEIVEQQLYAILDESIWSMPIINLEKLQKLFSEMTKYFEINKVQEDENLKQHIIKSLQNSIKEYDWKDSIHKSLLKPWNSLVSEADNSKPSNLHSKLDDLVSNYYMVLGRLLSILNDTFLSSSLNFRFFPPVSAFEDYFKDILADLKQKSTKLKIQLKLCPGVEPPQIKRIQKVFMKIIKKPYTEWNSYSVQQLVEIEKEPSCVMIPLFHRLMSYTTESKITIVSYYAPTGWEVTRIVAYVIEGNYKTANIRRTACKGHKAMAEVEVTYPRVTREHVWCKVQLEGVLSKKSIQEIKIPEFKTIIVTVDDDGEHELPPEFLEEIE